MARDEAFPCLKDPEFEMKVREIREVMVNPNGRLIFEDEKTTLVVKAYKDLWSDREARVEMPQEVTYISEEERVRYRTYQGKTSKEFIDFLRYLKGIHPPHQMPLDLILWRLSSIPFKEPILPG